MIHHLGKTRLRVASAPRRLHQGGIPVHIVADIRLVLTNRVGSGLREVDDVESFVGGRAPLRVLFLGKQPARPDGNRPVRLDEILRSLKEGMSLGCIRENEFGIAVVILALALGDTLVARLANVAAARLLAVEHAHDRHDTERVRKDCEYLTVRVEKRRFLGRPVAKPGKRSLVGLVTLLDQAFLIALAARIKDPPEHVLRKDVRSHTTVEPRPLKVGPRLDRLAIRGGWMIHGEIELAEHEQERGDGL